jgi:hypothetical protein
MTAAAAQAPAGVLAAIARIVAYNWPGEELDYGECGTAPGQNSRQGHVFEDLTAVRRWLDGDGDGGEDETARLTALADSLGADWLTLGEHVHDLAGSAASEANNNGTAGQVAYLVREAGPAEAERLIRAAVPGGTAPQDGRQPSPGR